MLTADFLNFINYMISSSRRKRVYRGSLSNFLTAIGLFVALFSLDAPAAPVCRKLFSSRFAPALEALANAKPESRLFWLDFSERFKTNVEQHFIMHAGTSTYEFPVMRDDPHVRFLNELGFVFPVHGAKARAPDLVEMLEALQLKVQKNIDSGLISANDALFPQMVVSAVRADQVGIFKNRQADATQSHVTDVLHRFVVNPGGDLPGNIQYIENSADQRATNLLSSLDYYKMISSGFFPLGGLRAATATYRANNEILHDLAHWSAMIQDPKLMASIKAQAKKKLGQTMNEPKPWFAWLDFVANEGLIVVSKRNRLNLPRFLGIENLLKKNPRPSQQDIQDHYARLSEDELDKLKYQIKADFERQFELVGGAARDYVSILTIPPRQFLYLGLFKRATSYANPESAQQKTKALAIFSYFTLETRHWTASEWYDFLLSDENIRETPHSPIMEILKDNFMAEF